MFLDKKSNHNNQS